MNSFFNNVPNICQMYSKKILNFLYQEIFRTKSIQWNIKDWFKNAWTFHITFLCYLLVPKQVFPLFRNHALLQFCMHKKLVWIFSSNGQTRRKNLNRDLWKRFRKIICSILARFVYGISYWFLLEYNLL